MSGRVSPSCDIYLPKEGEEGKQQLKHDKTHAQKPQYYNHRFFTFRQLNALVIVIILAAAGLTYVEDFAFVLFSLVYMYFLSKVAFPCLGPSTSPPVFGENNKILGIYVTVGAIVGLFLPLVYIFEGIYEGDKEGIKAAVPHLFLLASQVFLEGMAFTDSFSIPIRVYVPVLYNSRRIFAIVDWLSSEISKVDEGKYFGGGRRLFVGRILAVGNMIFWCFNLFGFLLPVYLPKAFKIYYDNKRKQAQD